MEITRKNEIYSYTETAETDSVALSVNVTKNLSSGTVNSIYDGKITDKESAAVAANFSASNSGVVTVQVLNGHSLTELASLADEFIEAVNLRATTATAAEAEAEE